MTRGRRLLFEEREKRVKPGRDEKVLASWNGLALAVLVAVVFFSLSQSKLPGYVLPAVPAALLLGAQVNAEIRAHAAPLVSQRSHW